MAKIKPDFESRNVKIIGLSVDPLDNHSKWAKDIEETQGAAPNYPIIGDADFNVSKLYGMLPGGVLLRERRGAVEDGGPAPVGLREAAERRVGRRQGFVVHFPLVGYGPSLSAEGSV